MDFKSHPPTHTHTHWVYFHIVAPTIENFYENAVVKMQRKHLSKQPPK